MKKLFQVALGVVFRGLGHCRRKIAIQLDRVLRVLVLGGRAEKFQPLGVDAFDKGLVQRVMGQHAKAGVVQALAEVLRGAGAAVINNRELHGEVLLRRNLGG